MYQANAGIQAQLPFTLLGDDGEPITGAANDDFTTRLLRRGVTNGSTVTVSEVTGGEYLASFTPDQAGLWYLALEHDPSGRKLKAHVEVGGDAEAHATLVDDGLTVRVEAFLMRNGRRVLDATSATVQLYSAAGTAVGAASSLTIDAQGFFDGSFVPSPALVDNQTYGALVTIVDPAGTVVSPLVAIAVSTGG